MKGVIFNILEDFVSEGWGEDAYEDIIGSCVLETKGAFIGPATYPDSDLVSIVVKASEKIAVSVPEVVRSFGRFLFPRLAATYPVFLNGHVHPSTFLKTVNDVIHVEIRKLFPEADPPAIRWSEPEAGRLVLTYASKRRLCALMSGLLDGAAAWFRTPMTHVETRCMHDGAPACTFLVSFEKDGAPA